MEPATTQPTKRRAADRDLILTLKANYNFTIQNNFRKQISDNKVNISNLCFKFLQEYLRIKRHLKQYQGKVKAKIKKNKIFYLTNKCFKSKDLCKKNIFFRYDILILLYLNVIVISLKMLRYLRTKFLVNDICLPLLFVKRVRLDLPYSKFVSLFIPKHFYKFC